MTKSKSKKSSFLIQGSILAAASIISRIIGFIYRIPITRTIGATGDYYYSTAFEIYNIMLLISSYSLPLAVSKLVSIRMNKHRKREAYQIFRCAFVFALISGAIVSIVAFVGAEWFAKTFYGSENILIAYPLRVLAPALFVVAILGVIRGFFQGMGSMIPSAISQILEQIVNAVISVIAAIILFDAGLKKSAILADGGDLAAAYGAMGSTLGTNMGSVFALIFVVFVLIVFLVPFKRSMEKEPTTRVMPTKQAYTLIIMTVVPVLLSTSIYNLSGFINNPIFSNIAIAQGIEDSKGLYGSFTGKCKTFINLPISIASAIAASSVPAITREFNSKNMEEIRKQIGSAMRFLMIIAWPSTVGLAVLAKPIFMLIYGSNMQFLDETTYTMWVGVIAVVFYSISTLTNAVLQAIDKMKLPVIHAAISIVLQAVLLAVLMYVFDLSIYAVAIVNAVFGLMMSILNGRSVRKYTGYKHDIVKLFIKPGFSALIMGVACEGVYFGMYSLTDNNTISFFLAFIVAVIVYALTILLIKGIEEEDILKFPKGRLLVSICKKLHLLR